MLSSKNWASPMVKRAEETRLELYRPVGSMEEMAAAVAVAASATAEAASAAAVLAAGGTTGHDAIAGS